MKLQQATQADKTVWLRLSSSDYERVLGYWGSIEKRMNPVDAQKLNQSAILRKIIDEGLKYYGF